MSRSRRRKTLADAIRQSHPQRNGTAAKKPPVEARPAAKVRRVEAYQPFPVAALPTPLREYVIEGATALGCDVAYLALPAIALAAGLIGYTRILRLKRSWRAPSVLWTLIVAESGSLKTPAFRLATDRLFAIQKRLGREFKQAVAEYADAREKWEIAAHAAKKSGEEPPGDKPLPPVERTAFTSNATIEAVAELIAENPRGMIVACDELASWLGSFTRYKGKAGGSDLPHWLSMHSAGGFAYHRKTGDRRRIIVPHAAVSIAGGIQPGILASMLAGEFMDAGLAGRLLMAMPPRPPKVWSEVEIDPTTEQRYHGLLDSLYALAFDKRENEEEPHVLRLSPEAKAEWVRWYDFWGREQAAVEGEQAAALSKLEEAAARFGLLHHVITWAGRGTNDLVPVEAESIAAGVQLARWFAAEVRRIYATLSESEEERDSRRLTEWIRSRGGKVTAKELQRSNSRKYPVAGAAEMALDALADAGLGDWQERPHGGRGGRPTRDFVLRMVSDDTDDTDDTPRKADRLVTTRPDETTDDTPLPSDETPRNHRENGVSSVSSVVGRNGTRSRQVGPTEGEVSSDGPGVSSDRNGVSSDGPHEGEL